MDWQECCNKRIVKETKEDKNTGSAMKRNNKSIKNLNPRIEKYVR